MANMEYLKDMPIAVLGGGAVGKSCAADMKLAGKEVRLYDMMPFAKNTLANLEKTGILLDGVQRNLYCFERSGRAYLDMVCLLYTAYLYFEEMNIDPSRPDMEGRDRFVLSKGHNAPGLYAVLAERGYFPKKEDVYKRQQPYWAERLRLLTRSA